MAYNICKKLVGREALLQYEGMEQGPEPPEKCRVRAVILQEI
jgi:hypothetical protein